jgi:hypothetical protein
MADINSHGQNLFSIADIEDTFGRRSQLRALINKVLSLASSVHIEAKRPVFQPSLSYRLINDIAGQIENLELADDLFSLSFDYVAREQNDQVLKLLLELWFDYEQPFFCFFQAASNEKRKIEPKMTWKEVIALEPCLVMFKSAEENVIWIGKSETLDIDFKSIFEGI